VHCDGRGTRRPEGKAPAEKALGKKGGEMTAERRAEIAKEAALARRM
jgi:hypothetical protein